MGAAGQNAAVKEAAANAAAGKAADDVFQPNHPCNGVTRIVDADKGDIELLMADGVTPRKKIALVGFASSTRGQAPFDEPEWAIAGMNQLSRMIPRADFWFEMHSKWNTALVPGTDYAGWLGGCGMPVIMTDRVEGIPTSVRYPVEELSAEVTDYFTSTVAYMVAFAIRQIDRLVSARLAASPTNGLASLADFAALQKSVYAEYTIGIFGIDLIVGEEYDWQKACAEFWIGQALAKGITVMIPPQSALCRQLYRYGYQMQVDSLITAADLAKRKTYLEAEHQKHSQAAIALSGAIQELEYFQEFFRLRERGGTLG